MSVSYVFIVVLVYILGKWFVSTGKDNLLNAWRTPYGASIFQVRMTMLLKKKLERPESERVDSDIFTYVTHPKWDAEMRVTDFFLNDVIYFYFSSSPKNLRQCLAVTSLWMIST